MMWLVHLPVRKLRVNAVVNAGVRILCAFSETPEQGVSTRVTVLPGGHLTMSRDIFLVVATGTGEGCDLYLQV